MGLGLGGFIDGIVLHQILQWHHMLTDTGRAPEHDGGRPGGQHAGRRVLPPGDVAVRGHGDGPDRPRLAARGARAALARPRRDAARRLGDLQPGGGLIDHQLLGIHHVRDDLGGPLGWDLAFLALGALLVAGGLALARSGERAVAR
jgi:hypothetical protein